VSAGAWTARDRSVDPTTTGSRAARAVPTRAQAPCAIATHAAPHVPMRALQDNACILAAHCGVASAGCRYGQGAAKHAIVNSIGTMLGGSGLGCAAPVGPRSVMGGADPGRRWVADLIRAGTHRSAVCDPRRRAAQTAAMHTKRLGACQPVQAMRDRARAAHESLSVTASPAPTSQSWPFHRLCLDQADAGVEPAAEKIDRGAFIVERRCLRDDDFQIAR
jgi:hypothetical protein